MSMKGVGSNADVPSATVNVDGASRSIGEKKRTGNWKAETEKEGSESNAPPLCSSPALINERTDADRSDANTLKAHNVRVLGLPRWLFDLAIAELRPTSTSSSGESPPTSARPPDSEIPMSKTKRLALADAYIAKMPEAISGHSGRPTTYGAAVALIRGYSFDHEDTDVVGAFETYNDRCVPPWKDHEIRAKLKSADTDSYKNWGYLLPFPTYEALHARATQVADLLPISPYQDHLHLLACLDSSARAAATNGYDPTKLDFAEDLDTRLAHAVVRMFGSEQLFIDLMMSVKAGEHAQAQLDPLKYLRGKYAEGLLRFADDMTALERVRFFAADVSRTKLYKKRNVAQVSASLYLVPSAGGPRFEHRVAIRLGHPALNELSGEWEETLAALPRERFLQCAETTLVEREAEIEGEGIPFRYARVGGLRSETLAVVKTSRKTGKPAVRYLLPLSFEATAKAIASSFANGVAHRRAGLAARPTAAVPSPMQTDPTATSLTAETLASTKGTR
jgi:hypothetical protein